MNPITRRQFVVGAGAALTSSELIANLRDDQGPIIAGQSATRPIIGLAMSAICADPASVNVGDPVILASVNTGIVDSWALSGLNAADFNIDGAGQITYGTAITPGSRTVIIIGTDTASGLQSDPVLLSVHAFPITAIELRDASNNVITSLAAGQNSDDDGSLFLAATGGQGASDLVTMPDISGAIWGPITWSPSLQVLEMESWSITANPEITTENIVATNDCTDVPVVTPLSITNNVRVLTSLTVDEPTMVAVTSGVEAGTIAVLMTPNGERNQGKTYDTFTHNFPAGSVIASPLTGVIGPHINPASLNWNLTLDPATLPDGTYTITVNNSASSPQSATLTWDAGTQSATQPQLQTGSTIVDPSQSVQLVHDRVITDIQLISGDITATVAGNTVTVTGLAGATPGTDWVIQYEGNAAWLLSGQIRAAGGGGGTAFKRLTRVNPESYLSYFGHAATQQLTAYSLPGSTYSRALPTGFDATISASSWADAAAKAASAPAGNVAIVINNGTYNNPGDIAVTGKGSATTLTFMPQSDLGVTLTGTFSVRCYYYVPGIRIRNFNVVNASSPAGYCFRVEGDGSKVIGNKLKDTDYGSCISLHHGNNGGVNGNDCEAAWNELDGFKCIGISWTGPGASLSRTWLTNQRQHLHHNTYRNAIGPHGTPILGGYNLNVTNTAPADYFHAQRQAGAYVEFELFDGPTYDAESWSGKSDANILRFCYFRGIGLDNRLQQRMSDGGLIWGNLVTLANVQSTPSSSTHTFGLTAGVGCYWLYNQVWKDTSPSAVYATFMKLEDWRSDDFGYHPGKDGVYRKNIFENMTAFFSTTGQLNTSDGENPTGNLVNDNLALQSTLPGTSSYLRSVNTIEDPHVMPASGGDFLSATDIDVDMTEIIIVPNTVRGNQVVDPSGIPWLADVGYDSS